MEIETMFNFEGEKITVQCYQANYVAQFANLALLEKSTGKPLSFGKPLEEFISRPDWETEKANILVEPILNLDNEKKLNLFFFFEYCIAIICFEKLKRPFPIVGVMDKISFALKIPGYQKLSEDYREKFEYDLLREQRLEKLTINGSESKWSGKHIRLFNRIKTLINSIIYISILASFMYGTNLVPNGQDLINNFTPLLVVTLMIAIVLLGFWIFQILWIFLAQLFMPKKLIHIILFSGNTRETHKQRPIEFPILWIAKYILEENKPGN